MKFRQSMILAFSVLIFGYCLYQAFSKESDCESSCAPLNYVLTGEVLICWCIEDDGTVKAPIRSAK